jgi:hypothetical protein
MFGSTSSTEGCPGGQLPCGHDQSDASGVTDRPIIAAIPVVDLKALTASIANQEQGPDVEPGATAAARRLNLQYAYAMGDARQRVAVRSWLLQREEAEGLFVGGGSVRGSPLSSIDGLFLFPGRRARSRGGLPGFLPT